MRRKNYTNKKINIFDNFFFLKTLIKSFYFKKLKITIKKNSHLNYFFYNFFLKNYKKNNLNWYINYFFKFNLQNMFIFIKNNFKKQFSFNINELKMICEKNKFQLLFLKKNLNFNLYLNNCILINNFVLDNINIEEFSQNFILLDKQKFDIYINENNLIYFINFNIFIINVLELYKILILIYFFKFN